MPTNKRVEAGRLPRHHLGSNGMVEVSPSEEACVFLFYLGGEGGEPNLDICLAIYVADFLHLQGTHHVPTVRKLLFLWEVDGRGGTDLSGSS